MTSVIIQRNIHVPTQGCTHGENNNKNESKNKRKKPAKTFIRSQRHKNPVGLKWEIIWLMYILYSYYHHFYLSICLYIYLFISLDGSAYIHTYTKYTACTWICKILYTYSNYIICNYVCCFVCFSLCLVPAICCVVSLVSCFTIK